MKRLKRLATLVGFCLPLLVQAEPILPALGNHFPPQRTPWLGEVLQLNLVAGGQGAYAPSISGISGAGHRTQGSVFANLILSPWSHIGLEFQGALSDTRDHGLFFDFGQFTGRYLLWDQAEGAPLSIGIGGSILAASHTSRCDLMTGHLAPMEFEAHLSVGWEQWCTSWHDPSWIWRYWATGACRQGSKGAPRLTGIVALARRLGSCHFLQGQIEGVWGTGWKDLTTVRAYTGDGPIKARWLDLSIGYLVAAGPFSGFSAAYTYRPLARNTPAHRQTLTLSWVMPLVP